MKYKFLKSWSVKEGINKTQDILKWVEEKNSSLRVVIRKVGLESLKSWFIDEEGTIRNNNGSFFTIKGFKKIRGEEVEEQPIIIQDEIGYLGFICKEIDGVLHFLVQAKIEPGNINKIQLSPTIQATKSNFEQKHGGKKPAYLDYFLNAEKYNIIVDQIQSEQSERFLKKRNRNIIIEVDDDVEVLPSHMWMTLGQIKNLMRIDNLVNMDSRTVLSCIPYSLMIDNNDYSYLFEDKYLYNSLFNSDEENSFVKTYRLINNYKMFNGVKTLICPLNELNDWHFYNNEFISKKDNNFKVVFCDLEIEGREVKSWGQPLFEATGIALFVLFMAKFDDKYKFLVKLMPESGSFDKVELGPTVQNESVEIAKMPSNKIEEIYLKHLNTKDGIIHDVLLSEEGGRFYQEQNRNIVVLVDEKEIGKLDENYIWLDYKTLNLLQQTNNVLNIQLRNLLSLLEVSKKC